MCSNDFAAVGAEILIFRAVAGIDAIGLCCMCWKTRRTEAAGRPSVSICRWCSSNSPTMRRAAPAA
jgi:hypothetical protein